MLDRVMGVVTLKAPTYREIADDKNATMSAGVIVVLVSLIAGFFQGLVQIDATGVASASVVGGIVTAIVAVIIGLIAWVVSAWVLAFVAKQLGGKTDTSEMLRVTGYVKVFGLVGILAVLGLAGTAFACIVGLVGLIVAILQLIGYLIGVREAAEFSTTNAIITAIIAAIINFIIVVVIGGAITLAFLAVFGAAAALGG